jgi:hypothetical protein
MLAARRKTLLRTLDRANPKLANVYRGAVHMVDGPVFPGRETFVAHAVRELRNGLPRTFAPRELDEDGKPIRNLDHHKHLAALYEPWTVIGAEVAQSKNVLDPKPGITIPWEVADSLTNLIEKDKAVSEKNQRRFLQMCTVVSSETVSWIGNDALAKRWMDIEAQGIAHVGSDEGDEKALALFREIEDIILNIFDYAPERAKRIIALAQSITPNNLQEGLQHAD